MAVCGLPEPHKRHALKMARFAAACIDDMKNYTLKLELCLGPGTADLALRVGLHSGPTIAGVLRGDRARFQLFGDTVSLILLEYLLLRIRPFLTFMLPDRSILQVEWNQLLLQTRSRFQRRLLSN